MRVFPVCLLFLVSLLSAIGEHIAAPPDNRITEAINQAARAYENGDCQGVLAALGSLPRQEEDLAFDGLSQYRLGYCTNLLRRGNGQQNYAKAAEILGLELTTPAARLEAYFYRVNALFNLQKESEAVSAAQLARTRWKAGQLTIASEEPQAWFMLGKLLADSGNADEALEPFGKAVTLVEKGEKLRPAYLERILLLAAQRRNGDLARRAQTLLGNSESSAGISFPRAGLVQMASGAWEEALATFTAASNRPGETAASISYAKGVLERTIELKTWGLAILDKLPDGRNISDLRNDELQKALGSLTAETSPLFTGLLVEVPRAKKPGTSPAPDLPIQAKLRDGQQRMVPLLLEAVRRQLPLQEWAISGGYQQQVLLNWNAVFVQRNTGQRSQQLIDRKLL